MTDAFRQKLLNWFTSMAILLLASAIHPLHFWFFRLQDSHQFGWSDDLVRIAGPFGETLLFYPLMLPIFLIWHLSDFIQNGLPSSRKELMLTRYSSFLLVMVASMVPFTLMVMGLWQYNSCDELPDAFFHQCILEPSWWLMTPWLATIFLALVLCITKGAISVRSLLKKAK
ncbi:MAG: hypothetical protein AAGL10_03625 [Pseudomonadota bacterium]